MREHERRREGWPPCESRVSASRTSAAISRFEMKDLGRINLIVGANNSGKTTILEAISILDGTWRSLDDLVGVSSPREVRLVRVAMSLRNSRQVRNTALFRGHRRFELGTGFRLSCDTDTGTRADSGRCEHRSRPGPQGERALAGRSSENFLPPRPLALLGRTTVSRIRQDSACQQRGGLSSIETTLLQCQVLTDPATCRFLVSASALTADTVASSLRGHRAYARGRPGDRRLEVDRALDRADRFRGAG